MTTSIKQTYGLLEPEQLILKGLLCDAGLIAEMQKIKAEDAFISLIKKAVNLPYKVKQAAMRIYAAGDVEIAIDCSNDSYLKHIADKKEINAIDDQVHRFFKPLGWKFEIVKWAKSEAPFYNKTVRRDGIVYRDSVLVGVQNKTNSYILIRAKFDEKTHGQIGAEVVLRFKTFKELVNEVRRK